MATNVQPLQPTAYPQPQQIILSSPAVYGGKALNDVDSKYNCCCGVMHVRTGAIVIGVLELLGITLSFAGIFAARFSIASIVANSLVALLTVLAVGLMFTGVKKQNPSLIVPHLIYQIFYCIISVIFGVAISTAMVINALKNDPNANRATGTDMPPRAATLPPLINAFIFSAVVLVGAAVQFWFFVVVLNLYRYYKAKQAGLIGTPSAKSVQYIGHNQPLPQIQPQPYIQGYLQPPYPQGNPQFPPYPQGYAAQPHFQEFRQPFPQGYPQPHQQGYAPQLPQQVYPQQLPEGYPQGYPHQQFPIGAPQQPLAEKQS